MTSREFLDSVLALRPRIAVFDCDGTLWAPDGSEDAVFTLCGPALHRELVVRDRNFVAARRNRVFVDAVRTAPSEHRRE